MKSSVEWHNLYEVLVDIRDNVDMEVSRCAYCHVRRCSDVVQGVPKGHLLTRLPDIALLWRLPIVREVVLSGFQLDLYSEDERAFAYWYSVRIMEEHLDCLDNLLLGVSEGGLPVVF